MFKSIGKVVAEKVVGVLLLLLALGLAVLIWRYHQHLPTPGQLAMFILRCLIWLAAATLLPWVTFFLVGWVQRAESNLSAALLLVFWALADGVLAWWLIGGDMLPPFGWIVVGLAFGLGGLYNLIAANQIAARMSRS